MSKWNYFCFFIKSLGQKLEALYLAASRCEVDPNTLDTIPLRENLHKFVRCLVRGKVKRNKKQYVDAKYVLQYVVCIVS